VERLHVSLNSCTPILARTAVPILQRYITTAAAAIAPFTTLNILSTSAVAVTTTDISLVTLCLRETAVRYIGFPLLSRKTFVSYSLLSVNVLGKSMITTIT
jgi:hypothetical protein